MDTARIVLAKGAAGSPSTTQMQVTAASLQLSHALPPTVSGGINVTNRMVVLGRNNADHIVLTADGGMYIIPDMSNRKGDRFGSLGKEERKARVCEQEKSRVCSSNFGQKATA